jgi:hypothetical protein
VTPGYHAKDKLETTLHDLVCEGKLTRTDRPPAHRLQLAEAVQGRLRGRFERLSDGDRAPCFSVHTVRFTHKRKSGRWDGRSRKCWEDGYSPCQRGGALARPPFGGNGLEGILERTGVRVER